VETADEVVVIQLTGAVPPEQDERRLELAVRAMAALYSGRRVSGRLVSRA
jgi:hypothetical protein